MSSPVYVAGLGIITAIGNNKEECLSALEEGRDGIGPMKFLRSAHKGKIPVAEVKLSNDELAQKSGFNGDISRTAMLSLLAANEAIEDTGLENLEELRIGFISANTVGGMDKSEDFFVEFLKDPAHGRLRNVVNHECGSITELVADQLGIHHYRATISTACSSSANAIFYAARLIKHQYLDLVIAGGTDALTRFTLNGFNTLMILDHEPCKPFDEERRGLNLGEGAGYLALVSEELAGSMKKKIYSRLSGYCNANDAYHQTASSPEGTGSFLAMKGALDMSSLRTADISYINLHGTGTQNNDIAEGTAIKTLFAPQFPPMSSTKSFTGHTLGASGGVEAVFSVMAMDSGLIFPNLRLQTPMKELPFVPERSLLKNQDLQHVMSNSFGFGGNCTSLIFSKK
jgi:3-oxoacyl-[acyl-carrier-protein] synthase-1